MSKRSRTVLLWLAFLSFSVWLGQGLGPVAPSMERLKTTPIHRPYLFRLEKDGRVSYLLGTQHVGLSLRQFPAFVIEALRTSPVFAAEDIDADGVEPRVSHVARFEQKLLSKKSRERLRERGLSLEQFSERDSVLKVCATYSFWEAHPEWVHLDKELEKKARQWGKRLIGLDSSEDMTRVLENAAQICDPNTLTESVSPEQARDSFVRGFADYISGDESHLVPSEAADNFMLLSRRNTRWLDKIERAHSDGVFVAVGALHLGGSRGLLEQLRQRGFRLSRVEENATVPAVAVSQ